MIIRSGFNVYPAEIESVLNQSPAVLRSAAVGRAEADGNEEVIAFVELSGDTPLDEAALREFLCERLAPYKHPAQLHVVDAFPMTDSGKVLKGEPLRGIAKVPVRCAAHWPAVCTGPGSTASESLRLPVAALSFAGSSWNA